MRYLLIATLGFAWPAAACDSQPANNSATASETAPTRSAAKTGPVFVPAPAQGDVAGFIKQELDRSQGQDTLVYVSASWCEPCRHFERAVKSGDLREVFPSLRLLKFDFDRDEDRLAQAGYAPERIPLFAVPGKDGRASDRSMEGSIKGPAAVTTNLVPRLRQLLAR